MKKAYLLRCAYHSSLRRTQKYASFLMTARALHLCFFEPASLRDTRSRRPDKVKRVQQHMEHETNRTCIVKSGLHAMQRERIA